LGHQLIVSLTKVSRYQWLYTVKECERVWREGLNPDAQSVEVRQPQLQISEDRVLVGNRCHRVFANAKKGRATLVNASLGAVDTRSAVERLEHHMSVHIYNVGSHNMASYHCI
jgi:hypothetical protein